MPAAKMLICDLGDAALRSLGTILGNTCSVSLADGIDEANAIAGSLRPDVIIATLSDATLAAMDTWLDRALGVAVILSYAQQDAPVARAIRAGAAYCLPAPLDVQTVQALMNRIMEQRRMCDAAQQLTSRVERELASAGQLQAAMLPPAEALISGVAIARRWRPCAELGGDLLDYADAGGSTVALCIADVSGHGAPAAMLTTLVKSAFRSTSTSGFAPRAVLDAVVAGLSQVGADRFVTMISARIDARKNTIEYVNAGHPAAVIFRRGEVIAKLAPTGPLISRGLEDVRWDVAVEPFAQHSGLLMYTDGVVESVGDAGRFGSDRLLEAISRHRGGGAILLDGILASLDAFTMGHAIPDDITLLTASVGLLGFG